MEFAPALLAHIFAAALVTPPRPRKSDCKHLGEKNRICSGLLTSVPHSFGEAETAKNRLARPRPGP